MKHRLSHKQTEIIQLVGLVSFGFWPWLFILPLFIFLPVVPALIISVLVIGVTYYFSLKIYRIEFDPDFLYYSRRLKKGKIDLIKVVSVTTYSVPVYLFLGHAYIMCIVFEEGNRKRRIYTISKGLFSWTPAINSIPEIRLFRDYLQDKRKRGYDYCIT